jgi:flagellin
MLAYTPIRGGDDDQTITLSIKDASGNQQSLAIRLQSDGTAANGRSIDEALDHINGQIQSSGSQDLRSIVAVKQRDDENGGVERIVFLSPLKEFRVSVGATPGGSGLFAGTGPSQGAIVNSTLLAGGSNVDISTQATAEAAVGALAQAVSQLGTVQAVVGRGQNQFNFAISLAQTQIINLAASESRIRDADLAAEASTLTKAQVLQQAGIAALAQANSAPQAVLSLLRS